jgi:NADH:ubiquinone oxidoreductase subunit F (NADH-binding)/NADH:ubiquinone oxidoreductase subunit E
MADGSGGAERQPRRRRAREFTKGRQLDPIAFSQVEALLGGEEPVRDRLIEYLHLIQDAYGHLSAAHLRALAEIMRLPMATVYEAATFYAHFDIVKEGEAAPPPITIRVCDSLSCEMAGAGALLDALRAGADPTQVRVVRAPCMGLCDKAPAIAVAHNYFGPATPGSALAAAGIHDVKTPVPDYESFSLYRDKGGYKLLEACRAGQYTPDGISGILTEAGLRGLGGAGFPAGRKWGFVRGYPGPRYAAINVDEGEPGTFKDRYYLERDPHRMLEGSLIASWAVEAGRCFIYVRDEYPHIIEILRKEIEQLEAAGIAPQGYLDLRRGAGAYICGEESAMIESIEGKRGMPRNRPPYLAQDGVFGKPTLEQNAETMFWIRDIVEKGPAWFADQGRHGRKGLRSFSVSGRVKEPGVKLTPSGITMNELLNEYCGGMAGGHEFYAYLPGGASGGILPASMADIPMDFGTLEQYGCFTGSGAVIVLSKADSAKAAALNVLRFFEDESCGQCTPCRVGCEKAVKLLERDVWDEPLLMELSQAMSDASICGLGQAAPNPIKSVFRYFREELKPADRAQAVSGLEKREEKEAGTYAQAEAPQAAPPQGEQAPPASPSQKADAAQNRRSWFGKLTGRKS